MGWARAALILMVLWPWHGCLAQTLVVSVQADAPPDVLSPDIVGALLPGGLRVTIGQTQADFWWVSRVAEGGGPPSATGQWKDVPEGALLGAVRLRGALRDIRGRAIPPGVYTLRFGFQPANGDHLGVSPFREFLLVAAASRDIETSSPGAATAIDRARQTVGSSHPAVLSIDPPEATADPGTVITNDAGHQAVVADVAGERGRRLRFGLILVGRIEA